MSNIHLLRETNLLNVPATLREIADEIEIGMYGDVKCGVLVLDGAGLEVFYMGAGEAAPNAHLLLHCGAAKMTEAAVKGKV